MAGYLRIIAALAFSCLSLKADAQKAYYWTPDPSGSAFFTRDWQGNPVGAAYGGTGVANNAANTITFTGNYSLGLTLSGTTALTLPTSGTVATTANINTALPSITALQLYSGTGGAGVAQEFTQSANTVLGNATGSTAAPTALSMTACSTAGSAVSWTTSSGFGCNTAIQAATMPFTQTGTGAIANTVTAKLQQTISVLDYGAAGSNTTTTGTISASSSSLSLAAAVDFANSQGIRVNHAGTAFTLNPPTSLNVTPTGATGSTHYQYQIASIDSAGGVGAAITAVATTTGNATLNATNYNALSWTAASGTAPIAYAVYGKVSGTMTLLAVVAGTSWNDTGVTTITGPDWIPATPTSAQADWLITRIVSGGGTTSLVLASTATTAASSQVVAHDDTSAISAALTAASTPTVVTPGGTISRGGRVYFPAGIYNTSSTVTIPARLMLLGDGYGTYYGGSTNSAAATLIRGNFDGIVFSAPNDGFTISNMGMIGLGNGAGTYTANTCLSVGPTYVLDFLLQDFEVSQCYIGLIIDGVSNGTLRNIYSQTNVSYGIKALGAQGAWQNVNVIANGNDGLYLSTGTVNVSEVSPWISGLQTFGNKGWGVNVQANGLQLSSFFLNNDYLGEVNVNSTASTIQINNGQVQYAGLSMFWGTNTSAPGIYIGSGVANAVNISGVQFFSDQGNDIHSVGSNTGNFALNVANSSFQGSGSGGVAGHIYAILNNSNYTSISGINASAPVSIGGNFQQWSNSWIACNNTSACFAITAGSYDSLANMSMYQNNGSGKGFTSAGGTSYALAGVQVFGGSSSSGTVITPFAGTP